MAKGAYYRGVRGSAALATGSLLGVRPAAEALERGDMRRVPFGGELLGATRVRGGFAALPLDAFDRACPLLEAEEQAAYLLLLRLSVGEGRNFCRVTKKDLMTRLRLSERRLLRVLAALVAQRFARPLHRDNRGTLWRVNLPAEAFGEPLGDDVLVGRAAELRVVRGPGDGPAARSSREGAGDADRRLGTLARALAAARGATGAEGLAAATREVRELLAEGQTPERIAACIEAVRRRAAAPRACAGGSP